MKPLKPKFSNTVKFEIQINDVSKQILQLYAKYTKYTESEIVDHLISSIQDDDKDFVEWLSKRRYKKKAEAKILSKLSVNIDNSSEDRDLWGE